MIKNVISALFLINFSHSVARALTVKIDSHENLWVQCEVKDSNVKFFINGNSSGESGASGGGTNNSSFGLGTYGAIPGENTLKFELSEVGKKPSVSCDLLHRVGLGDKTKIHHFVVPDKDLKTKSFVLNFLLKSKGYYPALEPLMIEFKKELSKAVEKDESKIKMYMDSVRSMVIKAKDEAAAKKIIQDWIQQVKKAK